MPIKYKYTILYVADVTKTIEFYNLAFGFKSLFITPENDYGELDTSDTINGITLAFASFELANSNLDHSFLESNKDHTPFGIELGFTTDDVEATMAKAVELGAVEYQKPKQKPWGQTVGYLKDINGFLIEICTPMPSQN